MAKQKPILELIQERVTAARMSNADIAEKTGWHELRVWRVMTDRTKLLAEDVETFAKIFGVSVSDLYGISVEKAKTS